MGPAEKCFACFPLTRPCRVATHSHQRWQRCLCSLHCQAIQAQLAHVFSSRSEVMTGQQVFLTSAVQLQEVLLPRLPAADLLRLGLSCKALWSWIMSMPPAYWKVCLATLAAGSPSSQLLIRLQTCL